MCYGTNHGKSYCYCGRLPLTTQEGTGADTWFSKGIMVCVQMAIFDLYDVVYETVWARLKVIINDWQAVVYGYCLPTFNHATHYIVENSKLILITTSYRQFQSLYSLSVWRIWRHGLAPPAGWTNGHHQPNGTFRGPCHEQNKLYTTHNTMSVKQCITTNHHKCY